MLIIFKDIFLGMIFAAVSVPLTLAVFALVVLMLVAIGYGLWSILIYSVGLAIYIKGFNKKK